jgi:Ca2+-binding EF-hand superfamily protein
MGTVTAHMFEAFQTLEMRFTDIDRDCGGTLSFDELESVLLSSGFTDVDQLRQAFKRVDFDGNGTLDFAEFMALLYLFLAKTGSVKTVFTDEKHAHMVACTISYMEKAMSLYDVNKDRRLSVEEITAYFNQQWPDAIHSRVAQQVLMEICNDGKNEKKELNFVQFIHTMYIVAAKMPGTTVEGKYICRDVSLPRGKGDNPFASGTGERSPLWMGLQDAFKVLEQDFHNFDTDKDGLVRVCDIENGVYMRKTERAKFAARLQSKLPHVQAQFSQQLDFFEYMFLAFMMTQDGSYLDLVPKSSNSSMVKKCFIDLYAQYKHFDADSNLRLTYDELQNFFRSLFGTEFPNLRSAFDQFKYSTSAANGREALDMSRFFKLLYALVVPDGTYHPLVYSVAKMI